MSTSEEKKVVPGGAFWDELFQAGLYKRSQGRISRQCTFAALAIIVLLGGWRLASVMTGWGWFKNRIEGWGGNVEVMGGLAACLLFIVPGVWLAYRLVNYSRFADFLISVEAEMNKVSWPTRTELVRAVIVVVVVVVVLSVVLFGFDLFWNFLFRALGIRGSVMGGG